MDNIMDKEVLHQHPLSRKRYRHMQTIKHSSSQNINFRVKGRRILNVTNLCYYKITRSFMLVFLLRLPSGNCTGMFATLVNATLNQFTLYIKEMHYK